MKIQDKSYKRLQYISEFPVLDICQIQEFLTRERILVGFQDVNRVEAHLIDLAFHTLAIGRLHFDVHVVVGVVYRLCITLAVFTHKQHTNDQ